MTQQVAVIHTHLAGNDRIDSAIGNRNSEAKGFSMPPLQATCHVRTRMSTRRWKNNTPVPASGARDDRRVA